MKKVTKLFLSVAAIGALAAGLATSAMAMTATYDAGTVTIVAEEGDKVASTEKTLLILKNDATTVTAEDIVQIDQSEDIASVPVGELPAGTYYVRVGGDGNIDTATFTVSSDSPYNDPTIKLGDANGDKYVDGADANRIINYAVGDATLEGDYYQAADANDDGYVDGGDANKIVQYSVGDTDELTGKTLADKVNYVE